MLEKKNLFIFGLDRAGKTVTSNYFINKSSEETYRPTTSFSIKNWDLHRIRFHLWDAPGQEAFRKLWIRGFKIADIIIFVLDTTTKDRFQEAKTEFEKIVSEIPENTAPLLFNFHKMDDPSAQENLAYAQDFFKDLKNGEHHREDFQTSIKDVSTLEACIQYIGELATQK